MRLQKLLMIAGMLVAMVSIAGAQTALPRPNALGVYFDGESLDNVITLGEPATVDLFLVYSNPSIAFIDAWEVKVTIVGNAEITGVSLPVGSTPVLSGPTDWSVQMAAPMPCNNLTKLAVFTLAASAEQNILLYVGNVDNPSLPGDLPAVHQPDGDWSSVPVSSNGPSEPVAGINTTTPNENTSWGSVKSLFR